MLNGSWPDFLYPVRIRFQMGAEFLGGLWFPALLGIFIGPGLLIHWLGTRLGRGDG
jgi:hypothetical protein